MKRLSALQSRSQRPYDSDLESIENPRYPKPDDDEKVKPAPRQSVDPERDISVNDGGRGGRLLHSDASKVCRRLRCPPQRRRDPAGEVTLLGSIGFNGKATVVCMGRVRLIPHVLIEGPGAFPAEIDTRLSDRSAPARRPYRTPRTQRSLFWPSQGSFACKETSGRK